ncbi:MAG: protein-L-isoaspartate O-methyltransferase, partial [Thiohalocapsa sp.]
VATMTELLEVEPGDRVFELGTGSGYQAAVLGEMGAEVYSVEIVPELGARAREVLDELGYDRVHTRIGDGYGGWTEFAPFDAIVVTAASDHIPPPLIRQLKPGGRMLIPVGNRYLTQKLVRVVKDQDGKVHTQEMLPVAFVPLTGTR